MYFEKVWASDCSFTDNSMTPYLHFIFCFLRDNKTTIDNMQKGSAQPHVYAKDVNAMELCLPETSILQIFEKKFLNVSIRFQVYYPKSAISPKHVTACFPS